MLTQDAMNNLSAAMRRLERLIAPSAVTQIATALDGIDAALDEWIGVNPDDDVAVAIARATKPARDVLAFAVSQARVAFADATTCWELFGVPTDEEEPQIVGTVSRSDDPRARIPLVNVVDAVLDYARDVAIDGPARDPLVLWLDAS